MRAGSKRRQLTIRRGDEWYSWDSDNDGLTNAQEVAFGSDPYRLDSDLDGLADSVEYQKSVAALTAGDPLPYDPWNWDSNGNGYSDFDEYYHEIQGYMFVVNYANLSAGTFYSYSDADGDGLKNFEDSDPLNCNRDGDQKLNWEDPYMDDPYDGMGPPGEPPPPPPPDTDGDGIPDVQDPFPYGSFVYQGIEYGGIWVDNDNDGVPNVADPFPDGSYIYLGVEYAAPLVDQDGDGVPDGLDPWPSIAGSYDYQGTTYPGAWTDQDNDGVPDPADPTPNGSYTWNGVEYLGPWVDQDNDGFPDPFDPWPTLPGSFTYQSTEYGGPWVDQDNDSIPDPADSFPTQAGSYWYNGTEYPGTMTDTDLDGIPDPADPFPNGSFWYLGTEYGGSWSDADIDGIPDGFDAFPNGSFWYQGTEYGGEPTDLDGDEVPDAADPWPGIAYSHWYNQTQYPGPWVDQDADGIPDDQDSLPNDWWNGAPHYTYQGTEYPGSESDDRDGDGIPDTADAHPDDATNAVDSDSDGISDYDENTQHHTDPAKWDTDDDGLSDFDELFNHHTNPLLAKTNPTQPYSDFYMVDQADDDNDGIPNGVEAWYADQGYGMSPTDPADANGDLDGDGYTNVQAWRNGWSLIASLNTYDNDNDGILDVLEDAWNAAYPGILSNSTAADATEDFDGDGLMNYEEIALGLNPGSAHSRNAAVSDMQEWVWRLCMGLGLPNIPLSGANWNTGVLPEWQVSTDADNDGLPDGLLALATALNADPTLIVVPVRAAGGDYDGDSMPDAWEHLYHLDPRDASDAQSNSDSDSLINSLEYAQGRNPLVNDDPPLLIITAAMPQGVMGENFNATIELSNVITSTTFSIIAGRLPDGLSLDSGTGVISGTLAQEDGCTFTVQVMDQSGRSAQHDYYISGTPEDTGGGGTGGGGAGGGGGNPQPLTLTTTNAQLAAIVGEPFSATLAASGGNGGPYIFTLEKKYPNDPMPDWIAFDNDGKTIHGTPTDPGEYFFNLRVTDGTTTIVPEVMFTASHPLVFTTDTALPEGQRDQAYSQQIEVTGGYDQKLFSLSLGALPQGIVLTPGGSLTGTPTANGSHAFTVRATDRMGHTKDQAFTLVISEPPQPLAITTVSLPAGGVGIPYPGSVAASGGSGDYTFSGGGGELTVAANGSITGTPSQPGIFPVDVTVTDSEQHTANATFVVIVDVPTLTVTSGNKQIVMVGDTPAPVTISLTAGGLGLANVPVTMGSQSTTTEADGSVSFSLSAPTTAGMQEIPVSSPGGGATTVLLAAVDPVVPAGAGTIDGTGNAFLSAPANPASSPHPISDTRIEYRAISISNGTLEVHSSAHYYLWGEGSPAGFSEIMSSGGDYSKSGAIWRTSDPAKTQQGPEDPPPSMNSLNWSSGLNGRAWLLTPPDSDTKGVSGLDGLDSGGGAAPEKFDLFTTGTTGKVKNYREEGWFQVRLKRDPNDAEKPEVTKSFIEVRKISTEDAAPTTIYTVRTLTMNAGAMNSDVLTVVANQDRENVYLLPMEIKTIGFQSPSSISRGYGLAIQSDDEETDYRDKGGDDGGQWLNTNGDMNASNTGGERNWPIAFKAGEVMQMRARLSVPGLSQNSTVSVLAECAGKVRVEWEGATVSNDHVNLEFKSSSIALPSKIQCYSHDSEADAFKVTWKIKVGEGSYSDIGTSKHTLYVPLGDYPLSVQESIFCFACKEPSKGNFTAKSLDLVREVFKEFEDRVVCKVKPTTATPNGTAMEYNHTSSRLTGGAEELILDGKGRCGHWADLFQEALYRHGISPTDAKLIGIRPKNPEAVKAAFNAVADGRGASFQISVEMFVKNWNISDEELIWSPIDEPGLPAQGNADPFSHFIDHGVIEYSGRVFDPSYGVQYDTPYDIWENAALEFVGIATYSEQSFQNAWAGFPNQPGSRETWEKPE